MRLALGYLLSPFFALLTMAIAICNGGLRVLCELCEAVDSVSHEILDWIDG